MAEQVFPAPHRWQLPGQSLSTQHASVGMHLPLQAFIGPQPTVSALGASPFAPPASASARSPPTPATPASRSAGASTVATMTSPAPVSGATLAMMSGMAPAALSGGEPVE